jgi:recombination protein RecT
LGKNKMTDEKQIALYVQKISPPLQQYAVRDYNAGSFFKSAMLLLVDNPNLGKLINQPSLLQALRFAAATGLSLNPQEGKCAIIAYGNKVSYQIMKNGLIELAMESGKVDFITAKAIRENDDFSIASSMSGDDYTFSPALRDRGDIIGFFAAIKLKTSSHVDYMTKEEVDNHRDRYSTAKSGNSPWAKSYEGMGVKTILKRLLNNVSISKAVTVAVNNDNSSERGTKDITDEARDLNKGFSSDDALSMLKAQDHKVPTTDEPWDGELEE